MNYNDDDYTPRQKAVLMLLAKNIQRALDMDPKEARKVSNRIIPNNPGQTLFVQLTAPELGLVEEGLFLVVLRCAEERRPLHGILDLYAKFGDLITAQGSRWRGEE